MLGRKIAIGVQYLLTVSGGEPIGDTWEGEKAGDIDSKALLKSSAKLADPPAELLEFQSGNDEVAGKLCKLAVSGLLLPSLSIDNRSLLDRGFEESLL